MTRPHIGTEPVKRGSDAGVLYLVLAVFGGILLFFVIVALLTAQ